MILKKISWFFRRHPLLYIARFRLLSKNSSVQDIHNYTYNEINLKKHMSNYFIEINDKIFKNKKPEFDLTLIKDLSIWLSDNIKGGAGLSESSDKALQIMLDNKGGVCSDVAQVFNNFCVLNEIKVREWGVTRAPYDKNYGGHSFNEIFCNEYGKWVLIDVYSNILFYHGENTAPLSVIELYQLVRKNKEVYFKSFNKNKIVDAENIEYNYLYTNTIPFLICNYSNKKYDLFLKYFRACIPVFIIHFIIYMIGKSYHYRFPLDNYKKIFLTIYMTLGV